MNSGDSRERPAIDLAKQIACVAREIALRRSAYPKWVAAGKMKQEKASEELAAMEAVIETLKRVQAEQTS